MKNLKKANLKLRKVDSDGNCLFNAFSHQLQLVLGVMVPHSQLRALFCNKLEDNADLWRAFTTESQSRFNELVQEMRVDGYVT